MLSRPEIKNFVESKLFTNTIIFLICVNAITLGMETNDWIMQHHGVLLISIDRFILTIFVAEILLKLYVYRFSFFTNGWNVFDFLIVGISIVPNSGTFAIMRSLRILRALRLISTIPSMRRVISAIGKSLPGMSSIIGILALIFYVSAVMATKLFGQHPDPQMQEWFGNIGASAYTLFQIMTLESWSMGIVRPVMEYYPWAWKFFIPYVFITSFAVLNLFIAIIVDAMQTIHEQELAEAKEEIRNVADSSIQEIKDEIRELRGAIETLSGKKK